MIRSALSILAVSALAGCASDPFNDPPARSTAVTPAVTGAIVTVPPVTVSSPATVVAPPPTVMSQPATVVTPTATVVAAPAVSAAFRPGNGVIESVAQLHAPASASAGASSVGQVTAYRLVVRMDDGSVQAIDQNSRSFRAGDRINITTDGRVMLY